MTTSGIITSPTGKLSAEQIAVLRSLEPGQKIRVVQTIRVGAKKWQTTIEGTFREFNYLATGVTTQRIPEDDLVVPIVHLLKIGGELSSIAVDENTSVTVVT